MSKRIHRIGSNATTFLLVILAAGAVVLAFLGPQRARVLVNSPWLGWVWVVAAVLLLACPLLRREQWRRPGSLMLHVGTALVLAGGMFGSPRVAEWMDEPLPRSGKLLLGPGNQRENRLIDDTEPGDINFVGRLPFALQLHQAEVTYYPPRWPIWEMLARTYAPAGQPVDQQVLFAEEGKANLIKPIDVMLTVLEYDHVHRRVKLQLTRGDQRVVGLVKADEHSRLERLSLQSVYDDLPAWIEAGRPDVLLLPPDQAVREYTADLSVVNDNGEVLHRDRIEVNHPLHYGDYHVYLDSMIRDRYPVLLVVSDRGLWLVWVGFVLLGGGVIGQLWVVPAVSAARRGREVSDGL